MAIFEQVWLKFFASWKSKGSFWQKVVNASLFFFLALLIPFNSFGAQDLVSQWSRDSSRQRTYEELRAAINSGGADQVLDRLALAITADDLFLIYAALSD